MIPSKETTWDERLSQNTHETKTIPPWPSDILIGSQTTPIIPRSILIQPYLHMAKLIRDQVLLECRLGLRRDAMIIDATIPEQQLRRNADDPACGIENRARIASLYRLRIECEQAR
jgi:hypothetical protein